MNTMPAMSITPATTSGHFLLATLLLHEGLGDSYPELTTDGVVDASSSRHSASGGEQTVTTYHRSNSQRP